MAISLPAGCPWGKGSLMRGLFIDVIDWFVFELVEIWQLSISIDLGMMKRRNAN